MEGVIVSGILETLLDSARRAEADAADLAAGIAHGSDSPVFVAARYLASRGVPLQVALRFLAPGRPSTREPERADRPGAVVIH